MDSNELQGRVIALEALVSELLTRIPPDELARLLNAVESGLMRQPPAVRTGSTALVAKLRRGIPLR